MRTRREIEERVSEILKRHEISGPSVDVSRIAEHEGLPIIENGFHGDVSGALIQGGGQSAIAVNTLHHPNRKRFTIAHELAHYLLRHLADDEDHVDWEFSIIRRDNKSSEASDTKEIEANMFAANLLMPRAFVSDDVKILVGSENRVLLSEEGVRSLASRYRVSKEAMTFRLINLGFLPPY